MRLAFPWGLALLLPVAAAVWAAWRRRPPAVLAPDLSDLPSDPDAARCRRRVLALQVFGGLLLALAVSRPQWVGTVAGEGREAVDVMLVLDVSGSMDAVDLPPGLEPSRAAGMPSRLDCARRELERFMDARPEDRFGLVVFARRPYPACPLTFDRQALRTRLNALTTDLLEDGTGLTAAIALAAVHCRASPSRRQAMILFTDGRDNVPADCSPEEAARVAAARGVTVHVVGIGSERAVVPVRTLAGTQFRPVDSALDENRLRAVSEAGGGVFVRVSDPETFARAVAGIAATEKGRVSSPPGVRYRELFPWAALAALGAWAAAFALSRAPGAFLP